MASRKPVIHARDHKKGGADPLDIVFPTSNYSNQVLNDPAGGLVLYWKLDELGDTTTDAFDSSGNGHTGTYGASPHHPVLGVAPLADGTAAQFAGGDNGDLVSIGSEVSGIQAFGAMSIEFWVQTSMTASTDSNVFGTNGHPAMVASDTNTSDGRFFKVLIVLPTGEVDFIIFGTDATSHSLTSATSINDDARHYVVCTFDGTDMNIYIDGVLDATDTPSMGGFPLANRNKGFWVGSGSEIGGGFVLDDHFAGTLDEVALYTVALPLSSVETHFLIGGTAANPPSGTAGGVLSGNYPDPDFDPSVAGDGLGIDGANEVLSVNVDDSTIEINADTLRVKDGGITAAKIDSVDAADVTIVDAGSYFTSTDVEGALQELGAGGGGGGSPTGAAGGALDGTYPNPGIASSVAGAGLAESSDVLSVNVDGTTIEISSDTLRLKDTGPGATGPIGDATHVAAVTINAKGQVTGLSSTAITFPGATDVAVTAAPGSDDTASGVKIDLTAGESVAMGDPVYMKSDGKVWKADADTSTTYPAMGLATTTAAANATVTVLLLGIARHDAWSWTVGGVVYLSTSSGLTQTQPSGTDNAIQIIGIAPHADRLYVNPQLVWITHT